MFRNRNIKDRPYCSTNFFYQNDLTVYNNKYKIVVETKYILKIKILLELYIFMYIENKIERGVKLWIS